MKENIFWYNIETVFVAFMQVSVFSMLFSLPIRLLWTEIISSFNIMFLPFSVSYFSIVGIIFILLTLFKIIKTLF